jgi:glyoxylase-like metal-dependent hydrolase (beta-lactamase superfamily II)
MPEQRLRVRGFPLGEFQTNCYVVHAAGGKACWIIDAGMEPGTLIRYVRDSELVPAKLVLTHTHLDHIAGVDDVVAAFPGTPVLVHEAEREWLADPKRNLSGGYGVPVVVRATPGVISEGEVLELEGVSFSVLHTPGHSPGGITLYAAKAGIAFVGDALFAGSIGRTDFPGSSFEELSGSIRGKLYKLPEGTVIFPGHGPKSTIGQEKRSNSFVRA